MFNVHLVLRSLVLIQASGIKGIEPNFQAFAERVGLDSGWSLTLIAGGPDPMNAGRVKTAS